MTTYRTIRVRSCYGHEFKARPVGRDRWQFEAVKPIGGKPRHPYIRRLVELDADIRRQLVGAEKPV